MDKMSDRERYLLKALLYLLLYSNVGEDKEEGNIKSLLVSSRTPITDYGRSKTMMAG